MGIIMELADKYNMTVKDIKSAIMKAATGAYRMILQDLGVPKGTREIYFTVLKRSLPLTWKIVKEEKRIPTAEEVYKQLVAEWPAYKELAAALRAA